LKEGAEVEITIEAEPDATIPKKEPDAKEFHSTPLAKKKTNG
jgi:hypothetical protein